MNSMSILRDDDQTPDPDDELLVAYLDGELGNRERDQVEQRLMDDDRLRARLQELQSGWDWLDDLPASTPNEKLVESTLEMVVDDILKKQPKQRQRGKSHANRWLLAALVLGLIGAGITYAAVQWQQAQFLRHQLTDLALAEYLDAYEYGSDLQFMRELEADRSWSSTIRAARDVGVLKPRDVSLIAQIDIEARETAISEMEIDDRAYLESRWDRFMRMSPAGRDQIAKTAAAVAEKPDSESLLATMRDYAAWHSSLPTSVQERLSSTDKKTRREAVEEGVQLTRDKIQSGSFLSDEDVHRIYYGLEQFLDQRIATVPGVEKLLEEAKARTPLKVVRYFMIRRMLNPNYFSRGGEDLRIPPITHVEVMTLSDLITDEAKLQLDAILSLGSFDLEDSLMMATIQDWAETACNRLSPMRQARQTSLEWYRSLDSDQRDLLDLMPPDKVKREIDRGRRSSRVPFGPPPPSR